MARLGPRRHPLQRSAVTLSGRWVVGAVRTVGSQGRHRPCAVAAPTIRAQGRMRADRAWFRKLSSAGVGHISDARAESSRLAPSRDRAWVFGSVFMQPGAFSTRQDDAACIPLWQACITV